MSKYIDGFALPIRKEHIDEYQQVAKQVAAVWKEHGAIEYCECVGDDMNLEGTRSFVNAVNANEDEVIVFGWVTFPSKELRDMANAKVPNDPRMAEIVAPLTDANRLIFDASRMVYGGFNTLV